MGTNPPIETINPSKSKTWVTAVGGLAGTLIPVLLSVSDTLPAPWPAVIAIVIWGLTVAGVYKAPYKPEGTSVVSNAALSEIATPLPPTDFGDQPSSWR